MCLIMIKPTSVPPRGVRGPRGRWLPTPATPPPVSIEYLRLVMGVGYGGFGMMWSDNGKVQVQKYGPYSEQTLKEAHDLLTALDKSGKTVVAHARSATYAPDNVHPFYVAGSNETIAICQNGSGPSVSDMAGPNGSRRCDTRVMAEDERWWPSVRDTYRKQWPPFLSPGFYGFGHLAALHGDGELTLFPSIDRWFRPEGLILSRYVSQGLQPMKIHRQTKTARKAGTVQVPSVVGF